MFHLTNGGLKARSAISRWHQIAASSTAASELTPRLPTWAASTLQLQLPILYRIVLGHIIARCLCIPLPLPAATSSSRPAQSS